mmetsp:Transcript_43231/g.123213  ORF Transcript_43231/g.123213 Transcript_43231/m.123213 type:complete len:88 (-) Transcript_43231:1448-1711(-)
MTMAAKSTVATSWRHEKAKGEFFLHDCHHITTGVGVGIGVSMPVAVPPLPAVHRTAPSFGGVAGALMRERPNGPRSGPNRPLSWRES